MYFVFCYTSTYDNTTSTIFKKYTFIIYKYISRLNKYFNNQYYVFFLFSILNGFVTYVILLLMF